jgi:hypothetical protein
MRGCPPRRVAGAPRLVTCRYASEGAPSGDEHMFRQSEVVRKLSVASPGLWARSRAGLVGRVARGRRHVPSADSLRTAVSQHCVPDDRPGRRRAGGRCLRDHCHRDSPWRPSEGLVRNAGKGLPCCGPNERSRSPPGRATRTRNSGRDGRLFATRSQARLRSCRGDPGTAHAGRVSLVARSRLRCRPIHNPPGDRRIDLCPSSRCPVASYPTGRWNRERSIRVTRLVLRAVLAGRVVRRRGQFSVPAAMRSEACPDQRRDARRRCRKRGGAPPPGFPRPFTPPSRASARLVPCVATAKARATSGDVDADLASVDGRAATVANRVRA